MTTKTTKLFGYLFIAAALILLSICLIEAAHYLYKRHQTQIAVPADLNSPRMAALQVAFDNQYSAEQLMQMESMVGDQLKYQAWTQFSNVDHQNKYSIVIDGIRKTSDSQCDESQALRVWFFGGSTMYGVGIPWWDTIPSQFVRYGLKHGKCIQAVNFGVPYFFQCRN